MNVIYSLIVAWRETVREYRSQIRAKGEAKLDVKACAWTAGFPLSNTEVVFAPLTNIPRELESGDPTLFHYYFLNEWYTGNITRDAITRDFIGPAIDTGFRIATKATPRKFTLAVDTAFLLSSVRPPDETEKSVRFFFDGTSELRGVLSGRPYPIIWIDTYDKNDLTELEDKFIRREAQSRDDMQRYCSEFIKSNSAIMGYPFIVSASEPQLRRIPERYKKSLIAHQDRWIKEIEKFQTELKATEEEKPEDTTDGAERNLEADEARRLLENLPSSQSNDKEES